MRYLGFEMYLIPLHQNSQIRSTQPTGYPKLMTLGSLCSTQPTKNKFKRYNLKEPDIGKDSGTGLSVGIRD